MKKLLSVLLVGLLALSCFACGGKKDEQPEQPGSKPVCTAIDTLIQDIDGEDKCFWEDGEVYFNDHFASGSQKQKSAELSVQTEYDMWFAEHERDLDLANEEYYYPVEFEYDETKIEIESNPDKKDHFILKVLQPCEEEEMTSIIEVKRSNPYLVPLIWHVTITISTVE
ncbi:MAG: hypothetical protein HDT28_03195 [Clostridiales bacterium]|nr:hypothetical protein [Clostridiales bacterium]